MRSKVATHPLFFLAARATGSTGELQPAMTASPSRRRKPSPRSRRWRH